MGCKVNQYESRSLSESWQGRGWTAVSEAALADVIVVNSCAVTARAVADVRSMVRRLRREAPDAAIWLTGCAAEGARQELEGLTEADAILGQNWKEGLLHLPLVALLDRGTHQAAAGGGANPEDDLESSFSRQKAPYRIGLLQSIQPVEAGADTGLSFPDFRISGYDRSRPVLKVQDGCSHRCTYCIVPLTRGPSRSRPAEASLDEARRLLDAGFREITLSGINLRQYRHQLRAPESKATLPGGEAGSTVRSASGSDFWALVEFLEKELAPEWAGTARLRISSLEPGQLDTRAVEILGGSGLIAPQLHLSLQSGSPSVLRRMGRGHYDPARVADFLRELGKYRPLFGLGADILTGFPAETDAEFRETLDLCRQLPFSYAHIFPYSIRPGTKAADLPGQLPQAVKKERAALLRQVIQEKQQVFLQGLVAESVLHVVFESGKTGPVSPQTVGTGAADSLPHERPSGMRAASSIPVRDTQGSKHRSNAEGRLRGVCEYYADCILADGAERIPPGSITPVSVLGLEGGSLLVRPKQDPAQGRDAHEKA